MKQILFSILLLVSISILDAQNNSQKGITTEEEYNYMSKGYKIQIESGLDMKNGYTVGRKLEIKVGAYSFEYTTLLNVADSIPTNVGYIIKAVSTAWGNTYWYCLPLNNAELLNKMQTQISTLDSTMSSAFFKSYLYLTTMYQD
jgi:hypothetical protein